MFILYGSADSGPRNYFYQLFRSFKDLSKEYKNKKDLIELIQNIYKLKGIKPIVLTGTSLGNYTLDKEAILVSREFKLRCFSVIEHWSWYKKRFEFKENLLLPNKIIVNDNKAKIDSINEGLPEDKLVVLGNPVLENHAKDASILFENKHTHKTNNENLYNFENTIVFISESLTEFRFPKDQLGFDENIVFEQLKEFCKNNNYRLLIKLHPSESKFKYGNETKNFSYLENVKAIDLASIPYKIIGMGSMLLLELAMYRNDIISFRPNAISPFIGDLLEVTIPACDLCSLEIAMKSKARKVTKYRKSYIGSTQRIIEYLRGQAQ